MAPLTITGGPEQGNEEGHVQDNAENASERDAARRGGCTLKQKLLRSILKTFVSNFLLVFKTLKTG
jgi:hypothetical protein